MRSTKSLSWTERTLQRLPALRRVLGWSPLPPPPHVFALEPERLRYGRFESAEGLLRFQEYHTLELPPDLFHAGILGGTIRDLELFRGRIAALLERLAAPVTDAALVLPDAWLRLAFAESGELPTAIEAREEVLRFKLKRLVPYRVEELRVAAIEIEPLAQQEEPRRLLLGFALEALVTQLEEGFGGLGVRLGQITNTSLGLLSAVRLAAPAGTLSSLIIAGDDSYSLIFARDGEPVLQRYKAFPAQLPAAARAELVVRELRLTDSFLTEQTPGLAPGPPGPAGPVLLWAPPHLEADWRAWTEAALGRPAQVLGREHVPLTAGDLPPSWRDAVPMVGAVSMEVA